jgi:hypothetical protein
MNSGEAADLAIFILCISLLIGYNVLYFTKTSQSIRVRWRGRTYRNLWGVGAEARAVWAAAMMSDPAEGITGAQGIRNMVMGVSMIAAGITVLAGQLLTILTDPARLNQVAQFSSSDPISGDDALMSPEVKIGLSLGVLFLAITSLTQSVRLSVVSCERQWVFFLLLLKITLKHVELNPCLPIFFSAPDLPAASSDGRPQAPAPLPENRLCHQPPRIHVLLHRSTSPICFLSNIHICPRAAGAPHRHNS